MSVSEGRPGDVERAADGPASRPSCAPGRRAIGPGFSDAIRWWELGRIPYNLAMVALAGVIVARTWPHFQPAFEWRSVLPLAVLALLANLCYCAAYVLERVAEISGLRAAWLGRRWIVWLVGTGLALFIECYWILDEIYPAVPFRG